MTDHSKLTSDRRPLPHHDPPREHYVRVKGGGWKPKQAFHFMRDANAYILHHKRYVSLNYVSYRCSVCGEWHIGRMKNLDK